MANRTDPSAKSVHGKNPQHLVEKIVRQKIYGNTFWKEQCFGLTAETLVDKAMEIDHVGGTFGGNRKPSPFLCLVLKMLQIQPDKDIVVEFIKNEEYKYVRALGAFYLRLTGVVNDVYQYLEPLYNDYRKLRRKQQDGMCFTEFSLVHVDEFIDELLTKDYCCDIALPRIQRRAILESTGLLEPRRSALEDDFEEEEEDKEEDRGTNSPEAVANQKDYHHGRSPNRERDKDRKRDSYREYRKKDYDGDYDRGRDRYRDRDRDHDRARDRERENNRDRHFQRDGKDGREREREREREGRERDRRDRDRGRHRSRSRSRSRERREKGYENEDYRRRRGHGSESPRRHHEDETDEPKKKKAKKEKKSDGTDHPDPEIAEANRLRASLGLAPLRP